MCVNSFAPGWLHARVTRHLANLARKIPGRYAGDMRKTRVGAHDAVLAAAERVLVTP
jgi:hypothetical protein